MKKTSASAKKKTRKANGAAAEDRKKSWAALIYMVADDPQGGEALDLIAHRELDRIVHGGMDVNRKDLHVAVQVDFRSQPFVWRRIVGEGTWTQPETGSASPEALYGFFEWACENCPADRYAVIFWGHSSGPFGLFKDELNEPVGLFKEEDPWSYTAQTLTLQELRQALEAAKRAMGNRPIDILAFKDCFMSTLETACEIRELATFVVASQALVPVEGWPYRQMFAGLSRDKTPEEAAKHMVSALDQHYLDSDNRGTNESVPYALVDTGETPEVGRHLTALLRSLAAPSGNGTRNGNEMTAFRSVLTKVAPGDRALIDLKALCKALTRKPFSKATQASARRLASALRQMVVKQTPQKSAFGGISAFCFPPKKADQTKSLVAKLAKRSVYESLEIMHTEWGAVALQAMPLEAVTVSAAASLYSGNGNGDYGHDLLPRLVLEQLQRSGILEQLQLDGIQLAQRALASLTMGANLANKTGNFAGKTGNFSGKTGNFVVKTGNFAADKTGNFAADKTGNFAADKTGNFISVGGETRWRSRVASSRT